MKNKFFKKKRNRFTIIIAIFVGLLSVVGYACREEIEHEVWEELEAPKLIENAKVWYESHKPESIGLRSSKGAEQVLMAAEWSHAFATQNEFFEVIETNLMSQGRLLYIDESCKEKYEETNDPKYQQCYTRIVFRIDRNTNDTVGFLMTVVPNLDWLEKSHFKPFLDVTYLWRSKDFGGMILFHEMDGRFSNGWKYEAGKIVAAISAMDVDPNVSQLRSTVCNLIGIPYYRQECITIGPLMESGLSSTNCNTVIAGYNYSISCYDDGTSSNPPTGGSQPPQGSYTGGTGGTGGNGTTTVNPSANLSKLIKKQSLTPDQIKKLNEILDNLLKDCGFKDMYGYIVSKGTMFNDIKIDPYFSYSAGYDNITGNLVFINTSFINNDIFGEELVHLYQRAYYGSSQMSGYYTIARGNIEFEAKVIEDLLCYIRGVGCQYWGEGKLFSTSYSQWIISLTSDGTCFPRQQDILNVRVNGLGYWDFLSDFVQKPGEYLNASTNQFVNPDAISNINRMSVNNCINN